jgi:hypothetical protein
MAWLGHARAHVETSPLLVNRYLALIVQEQTVDVVMSLLYGEQPGADRRRAMDRNNDGRIDADELQAERERWRSEATAWFSLSLDGREQSPEDALANVDLGSARDIGRAPLTVEVSVRFPLRPGPHRLTLRSLRSPPALGETDVTIDLAQAWALVSSARGEVPPQQPPPSRLTWPSGSTPALPVATFEIAPASRRPGVPPADPIQEGRPVGARSPSIRLVLAAVAVALLGALVAYAARRRGR